MVEESNLLNETAVNDASREAAEKTFVKIFLEAAKRSQPVTTPRNAKSWWTQEVQKWMGKARTVCQINLITPQTKVCCPTKIRPSYIARSTLK